MATSFSGAAVVVSAEPPIHFALTPSRGLCVYRGPRVVASWQDPEAMAALLTKLSLGGNQISGDGVLFEMTEAQRRLFAVEVARFWAGA